MVNKRGRKRTNELYFGEEEEDAVIRFLNSESYEEKNAIFNEWLKGPLDKMVEAIIRRYKLYRKGETFEDLHTDTISFLMTKVDKFETGRGKKAYSYFGTIAKNYVLALLIKDDKLLKTNYCYEDMASALEEMEELAYTIDDEPEQPIETLIKSILVGIKEELDGEKRYSRKKLTENEFKVGYALVDILENWSVAFEIMNGGGKYNKNSVLETIREYTLLTTKDIRIAMKRFKVIYNLMKNIE